MLDVTEIRIKKIDNGDLLCFASICISEDFVVDGIKLLSGKDGRYIIMPSRKAKNSNKTRNYAYPIKNEIREQLLEIISDKYDEDVEE